MSTFKRGLLPRLLLILAFGLTILPFQTSAQSTPAASPISTPSAAPSFLLAPVGQSSQYFVVDAAAGSTTSLTVALGNAGKEPVASRTFAADVYTLTNGGFGINPPTAPASGATTWLDYPQELLDLAPGKTVQRSFNVTIPAGTPAGQYITGLVLETATPITIGKGGMLQQIIAKAVAVFITVPGALIPKLTIGDVTLKQSAVANSLKIGLENTGNVLLKPDGVVVVTTVGGDPVLTAPITMGSFYAGMSTSLEIPLPTILAPGDYRVKVTLADAKTGLKPDAPALHLTISAATGTATPTIAPITISAFTLEPVTDPASGKVQIVNVTVGLTNTGQPVPSAKLTMHVTRDGALVEDFPLNSSLVVPSGATNIQQRYLPLAGWTAGSYSFTVTLEAVDANSGQTTVLATAAGGSPIVAP